MSSKTEKTSHHSPQSPRLSIFYRNPLLLTIVAWLGSLGFISSTRIVWALEPISTSQSEVQTLSDASADTAAVKPVREIYGPYLPTAQKPAPVQVTPAQLPNREVPIAVTPASASIPTGTIVRPQHTDLLTTDSDTVGVNGSAAPETVFIDIPVSAPLSTIIPSQSREIVTAIRSQIQPSYIRQQPTSDRSDPATSLQPQSTTASADGYRAVPAVVSLPVAKYRSRSISTPIDRPSISDRGTPVTGIKPTSVTPMKSPATARRSSQSELKSTSIPAPRDGRIEVQSVAALPQLTGTKVVPTVPAIPSVRPAAAQSSSVAFTNTGTNESGIELIYPLASPAPTTSSFGWRTHPITGTRRFHSGVDIGAPMGAPVVAAGSGTVVSSGWLGGYGKAITIEHNGVQQTLYGHLSEIFVQPGQIIEQGTVIGRVGSTGNSTGPHLHFETKVSTADGWIAVDPGEDIKYALDNLRRSMPFAQRDLPPGYN